MAQHVIMRRQKVFVNTDPQRRCYNGAYYGYEWQWSGWESMERMDDSQVEDRLKFWRGLNDFAVSQRGQGAKCEYKAEAAE